MNAIVINHCCSPDQLTVSQLPIPSARPGWVVVRVYAAGLNHSEALLRQFEADQPYINTPVVPGIECVGTIHEVAANSRFHVGEKVVAMMGGMGRSFNGSYAEYALLPEDFVFCVDSDLDWISLAAVPETYYTAYGSLTECLLLTAGDRLMVRGATSTVGRAAIQLAKGLGTTVIAACRNASHFASLQQLGADYCVVDDGAISQQSLPLRPNKVLELVGPKTLPDSLQCVDRPGYVCNTGILGNVYTVPQFDPIKYLPNGVFLSGFYSNYPTQQVINSLFLLIQRQHIQPLYSRVFPLAEVAEAHRLLDNGTAGGKIILSMI